MSIRSSEADGAVRHSEVLAGLSYALDLTEGQRPGHAARSCLIGMKIAEVLGLSSAERSSLFYALLMKDLGCSSNSARFAALFGQHDQQLKAGIKTINWTRALESFRFVARNAAPGQFFLKRTWRLLAIMLQGEKGAREVVKTRCERGADIAQMLGLTQETASAIRALDEHWDGHGQPYGKAGEEIPLLARILGLAQTVEVFFSTYGLDTALGIAAARRGSWFDPTLVDALFAFQQDRAFWKTLEGDAILAELTRFEPAEVPMASTDERLDRCAGAFARVIDAKSPWTYRHSTGVADTAAAIASRLGYSHQEQRVLRRAALLHDLGKLGVSNLILDKPGKLTDDEFAIMRTHTHHTAQILSRVSCFAPVLADAAAHHERLDGRGYHRGLAAAGLSLSARILAVADICDALRSSRPYREGLPPERILAIMEKEVGAALDGDCVTALRGVLLHSTDESSFQTPAAQIVSALSEDYVQAA